MSAVKENNLLNSLSQIGVGLGAKNQAFELLKGMDFPTRKTEDWRYTPITKIVKNSYKQFDSVEKVDLNEISIPDLDCYKVIFVNGVYSKKMSDTNLIKGLVVDTFPNALEEHISLIHTTFNQLSDNMNEIFSAINTSYFDEGIFIYTKKSTIVDKPIHVININTENNVVSNVRCLVVAESFSEVNIVQTFVSKESVECFTNAVTEVFVYDSAKVTINKIQSEEKENNLICTDYISQNKNSSFAINTITLSGDFVRNAVTIDVNGENCTSEMNGLYMQSGKQHVDNHTKVNHRKPNCTSFELYKGVLKDKSTGVFNGKVIVFEDAQKIEAYQQNKNILLSKDATMNAKPELEIFADDVKCSHGTTTGQFDEKAIFYLQARGVSKESAKNLLTEAFSDEVLEKIELENLRVWIKERFV